MATDIGTVAAGGAATNGIAIIATGIMITVGGTAGAMANTAVGIANPIQT